MTCKQSHKKYIVLRKEQIISIIYNNVLLIPKSVFALSYPIIFWGRPVSKCSSNCKVTEGAKVAFLFIEVSI